jgi:hypothetical protein
MAVTNGWGKGVDNNTINWGRGKDNATNDWGKVYETSASGDTLLEVATPSFSNTKSLDFDGVDDYVTIGTPTNLKITGNVSVSAWVKTTSSNTMILFSGFDKWGLYFVSGKIRFNFRNASDAFKYVESSGTINDGNWHHVLGVNDQTNLKIYVDGSLSGSNTDGSAGIVGTSDTRIGARYNNSLYISGNIDEVAIWNNDQSANASSIYNSGTPLSLSSYSPLAWYRMGDGDTFPTLTDNGSGGNNGTMTNMVSGDIVTDTP